MLISNDKGSVIGQTPRQGFKAWLLASAAALMLTGCAVTPEPFTMDEHKARAEQDVAALKKDQEAIKAPLSLYDAMARAVKYNLDHRLKVMEEAFNERQLTTANLSMLPALTAKAGYEGRNNQSGSSSRSLLTGAQSLETSSSLDRDRFVYDYGLSWNVLDFGVSYIRAKQQADRLLIVQERKRKV
ncbi:MAG TPA: TolC family protein, partial [Candidatus Omnitrophota bacterium]|nr:TolC family protein [Candidatus Omnitrophota bacterium]